jgi:hypothetical protein
MNRNELQNQLESLSDLGFAREIYVLHLGRVFTTIAIFEHTLMQALQMPRKIMLKEELLHDNAADKMLAKRRALMSYTLGNLIRVLENHGANIDDVNYLKFIKNKRDFFIHKFFGTWPWPGDIEHEGHFDHMVRKLKYLEIIFGRAADRIWKILDGNGYIEFVDLGNDGHLIRNEWPFGYPDEPQ